jgi:long-chain acyl-CoA synthetase
VLPFFHVFAMTVVMNLGIATASEIIVLPRFQLEEVLKTIQARKPTLFPAVPTIFGAIGRHPRIDRYDLGSLRCCLSGGAPLPMEIKRRFEAISGCVLVEGYGLTEASPVLTCNPLRGRNKPGSVGLPLIGTEIEIRDLDDPARRLPPGSPGEICARGPQVMAGYFDNPAETEAALRDGWLRTGDVGHLDEDGYLYLTDRLKDVILCSGYKIYPRAVEDVLYRHPDVAEAVVVAVPDDYRGEAPKAFVTLRTGAAATAADLAAFAADQLNPLERPREVEIRDELPKTTVGKLSRKELAAAERRKWQERQDATEQGKLP